MTFKTYWKSFSFFVKVLRHVWAGFFAPLFQGHLVLVVPKGERKQEGCREKTWMYPPRIC